MAAAAFLLAAIACAALGDPDAVERAVGRAFDLTETGTMLFPFPPSLHCEPPTQAETRVLRYLPSNLSAREIADELYVSMNTVKTHQRHLYGKLGARTRAQAVERARALGLLAPSSTARAARAMAGAGCPRPRGGSQE